MKLLRTTTTDSSGLFNAFLNQDLQIEPFSKIALGQLSAALRNDILTINGSNDTIQFSTKAGAAALRTVKLIHGVYDAANRGALLDQLENAMDKAIGKFSTTNAKVTIADGNNIGKSVLCTISSNNPDNGKIVFKIHQSKSWSHYPDLTTNIFATGAGAPSLSITGTTEANVRLTAATDVVDNTYTRATFFNDSLCRGVGVFRIRLNNLSGTFANNDRGYTIAMTKINPNRIVAGRALTLNDFHVGIDASNPFDAGGYGVITSDGTTSTITPAAPAVTPNNGGAATEKDVLSIEICAGRLRCVVYQHDPAQGQEPHTRVIHDVDYDESIPLFGVIIVHGKSSACSLKDIKYTGNPFTDLSGPSILAIETDLTNVGKATPGRQVTTLTTNSLILPSITVAQWFGFQSLTYSLRGNPNVDFVADLLFKAGMENDLYLVELLNIQLESYDTFEEGRKNILAVVPYDDSSGAVNYDPNNLIFLDLNNKEPINLTSIKFRLVRADYSAPELIGITSAVLFFKGKGEL